MMGKRGPKNKTKKSFLINYWKILLIISACIIAAIVILVLFRNSKPKFDGKLAFAELVKQVDFGPRICGSIGHENTKEYLVGQLKKYADLVSEQPFRYKDKHDSTKIYEATNIVASFNISDKVTKRILLCAHWDSRPIADQDPDSSKRNLPVPAANDGASGVAVLLEMARLFEESKPKVGVDIVLFDLEDIGDENESNKEIFSGNPFGIGSEMFVKDNPNYFPAYGILLDMVGDKDLIIPKEAYSVMRADDVVEKVWKAAAAVGSNAFVNQRGGAVIDDHLAFLRKSIPVIDLIQTPFPKTWHTTNDISSNCSYKSLQQIGNELVEVIYNEN